ncbi:MAG: bifunctional oligoribonuclease/PAP phosphatase NrnA [Epsilonproteobacteria bacterium]|nr:bifunctional oligoribonuclease/PAP phosphatase NrnA [Campylobacterota bacterium]
MYKQIWDTIIQSDNITLISHVNPDGDAIGSSLALYNVLKKMNKNVSVVNTTEVADYLDFLPNYNKIKKTLPNKIDLLISLDCGSLDRLGIEDIDAFIINIDHHISNRNFGDLNLVEIIASTSQVLYNLFLANNVTIDADTAVCLYTALVTDTGNFQYESVTSEVFDMASHLVRCGVKVEFVSKMLYEREKLSRLRFLAKALDTLELMLDGKVGVVRVSFELMQRYGIVKDDTDGLVNMVRKLATVEVAMMLREEEDGSIKVSLRSKNYVDVSKIAAKYGGGGHIRASGVTFKDATFEQVQEILLQELKQQLQKD